MSGTIIGLLLLFLALYFDLREHRIPNPLLITFLLVAVLQAILCGLPDGFGEASLLFLAVLAVLWKLGLVGGGDVKLFLVVSMLIPAQALLRIFFISQALALLFMVTMSLKDRKLVRRIPLMPFVCLASLVLWL